MTANATLLSTLARRPATAEPDADLLGRFANTADPEAFAELVHRYARLVWRVARTRCHTDATAEDVFQATFVILSRKAGSVRSPAALAGWLHRTAHRLAVRATRRERPTVPLPPDLSKVTDPLDGLTARELLAAVDDELAQLSDADRAVLLLCGIDGLPNGEAATRLGVSTGSVKGRLERARQKVRDRLSARGLALPTVLIGLVGFAPPGRAVETAAVIPSGGAVSPAVLRLITEMIPMKAIAVLAAAVAGFLLLAGGFVTDTGVAPTAEAAPVPRELKPAPKEVWGEVKNGLQAGLRMPDGATVEEGQRKPIQVVVRNVGKEAKEVWYTPQQPGIGLSGAEQGGRFRLSHFAFINGRMPAPVNVVLKPGEELVRWHSLVRHAPANDDLLGGVSEPRLDLPAGAHTLHMHHVGGDIVEEFKPRDGPEAVHFFAHNPLALATGELTVRCVPKPRRNAPVPKDAPKPVETWGEAKDGLQAGLRMPGGGTVDHGTAAVVQLVVRNVGRETKSVTFWARVEPLDRIEGSLTWEETKSGQLDLHFRTLLGGRPPRTAAIPVKPGEEVVLWAGGLCHGPVPDDAIKALGDCTRLESGTHKLVATQAGAMAGAEALTTGELVLRLPPPAAPRRNAPVPKGAATAVVWSEPVRVDWKGSGAVSATGAWAADGGAVLVPATTTNEKGESIPGGGVAIRDAKTGKVTDTFSPKKGKEATFIPTSISIGPDGKTVTAVGVTFVAGMKGEPVWATTLWEGPAAADRGKVRVTVEATALDTVAVSPDGTAVAVVGGQSARLIDARRGLMLAITAFRAKKLGARAAMAFQPDSQLVVGTDDGQLFVVDAATGRLLEKRAGLGVNCRAVAGSPDGKFVAVGGSEAGEKGHPLVILAGDLTAAKLVEPNIVADPVPAKEWINGLAFSPDGKFLAAACSDGVLRVFDVTTGKGIVAAKEHKEEIFSVAYSPDGKQLLTVGKDAMKVWDVARLMPK